MLKVDAKRRLTLSASQCRTAGIEPGDECRVFASDGRITVIRQQPGSAWGCLAHLRSDWACYIRKHSSTVRARDADERELVGLAATVPFDDRYRQTASINDLSGRLVRNFLRDIGSDLAAEATDLSMAELGQRMNIVGGPPEAMFPKNVGLLFFNDRPHDFFPSTQIDVVWFPDGPGGDRFEEKEFRGPLSLILGEAIGYIERNYLKETVVKHPHKPEAERFWNFPIGAIEEALVNAIYHRSYEEREPVEVRITVEELMVLSFPGADRSIRMEDFRKGQAVSRRYFTTAYLKPALDAGLIEMTLPDKPTSRNQRYRRTAAGQALAKRIKGKGGSA